MDVAVTGSHGLIGTALKASLEADGHRVRPLTRPGGRPSADGIEWDPAAGTIDAESLEGVQAVVNLAGEGIASHRWTAEQKHRIRDSRVAATTLLAEALTALSHPPEVLVSGSAIGYYGGDNGDRVLTEDSPEGDDFLAAVCGLWEDSAKPVAAAGIRLASIRTGIVLAREGGALAKQLLPYRLGLGGPAGRGDGWLGWISLDDEVTAIRFLIDHPEVSGPVNLTAPNPVTSREFARSLGRAVHRPAVLPIPRVVRHLPFGVGELADNLLFASQRAEPRVLLEAGFGFSQPTLAEALDKALA